MLVTVERYRAITGDEGTSPASVSALIEEATGLLVEALDRPLESAERAERMHPDRDGCLHPHAIPVTDAVDRTIDGYTLKRSGLFPTDLGFLDIEPDGELVTYTGGWVERTANPDAVNRLPTHIERDLAWAAYALSLTTLSRQQMGFPAGATSVSLGDAAVSFAGGRQPKAPGEANIVWSKATLGYRYQRVGGYR